jgi:DNA-binding MurR/RpiR family transcriptional regulator
LLSEFIDGSALGLNNLRQTVSDADIAAAVRLIERAETVYTVGFRRSFPVSAYLAYSLPQAGKRAFFIDGVAGLSRQQVQTITSKDLLIAISYHPYAEETVQTVSIAQTNGAKVLAITDSVVSPIAKGADAMLETRESEIRGFRSLSASLCLAQAVVIAFAFDQERNKTVARRSTRKR